MLARNCDGLGLELPRAPAPDSDFQIIVLDTLVSEPMRPGGSAAVLAWLDRQVADTLYLTATSLAELLAGIQTLSDGKCPMANTKPGWMRH